jgi:uncharacterized protein DUF5666
MRPTTFALAVLIGVSAASTAALAAPKDPAKHAATTTTAQPASHSVKGKVTSMDDSSLVIAKSSKKGDTMTFQLNDSTQKSGTINVGAPVSVRYRSDNGALVATAVTGHAAKTGMSQTSK